MKRVVWWLALGGGGVLLAGLVMGVLVPTFPEAVGPRTALVVTGACVVLALWLGRRLY